MSSELARVLSCVASLASGAGLLLVRLSAIVVVSLALLSQARAASVTLEWDPNAEPDLAGYKVHYGIASRGYTVETDVGSTVIASISGLTTGTRYYFAVTAYDHLGNQSAFSNEVSFIPGDPTEPEGVAPPSPPDGPGSGIEGITYSYASGGAAADTGDPVQYQFLWGDGTASGWLEVGVSAATKAWAAAGTYTTVHSEARCATHPAVLSLPSAPITVVVAPAPPENVTTPFAPIGPASGVAGAAYTYETGGSVSSTGDQIQYRFSWADGTATDWLPVGTTSATKSWAVPANYLAVFVEARCATHTSVVSAPSSPLTVTIAPAPVEVVSEPAAPAGPAGGVTGSSYTFSAGGATSDLGHPVRYRFSWGDGTVSDWIDAEPASASKAWGGPGTYLVQVEAACALHPSTGALSPGFEVTIAQRDPLLFADDFSGWHLDDHPGWRAVSGDWTVTGSGDRLRVSRTPSTMSTLIARRVRNFFAGRLDSLVSLAFSSGNKPGVGLVFAYRSNKSYRYVNLSGKQVSIGQVGDTPAEAGGVKRYAPKRLAAGSWHSLKVELAANGYVRVFIDEVQKPVVSYRFKDVVPGMVGYRSDRTAGSFDDFAVWDRTVLLGAPADGLLPTGRGGRR